MSNTEVERYDVSNDETMSEGVIEAVARRSNRDPADLVTPLAEHVDPDALDEIFEVPDSRGRIEFVYEGFRVSVDSDDVILVA
jgi:hypothetical protein